MRTPATHQHATDEKVETLENLGNLFHSLWLKWQKVFWELTDARLSSANQEVVWPASSLWA